MAIKPVISIEIDTMGRVTEFVADSVACKSQMTKNRPDRPDRQTLGMPRTLWK